MQLTVPAACSLQFGKLHRAMSEKSVFLSPSSHETGFTYLAHSEINLANYHNPFAPLVRGGVSSLRFPPPPTPRH